MEAAIIWIALIIIFAVVEIITVSLTSIWFAGGALAAFFMALAGLSFQVQMTVFLAVSFVLLIFTRPFAVKYVNKGTVKTNVDGLVGKKARVLEEIDNGSGAGTAVLNGQEWTARAVRDDLVIHKGETVIVKEIRGVKLIVDRISEGE